MTDFNAFQHDGFNGMRSCGFNARNGPLCHPTSLIAVGYTISGNGWMDLLDTGMVVSSAQRWGAVAFDALGRIWAYDLLTSQVKCFDRALTVLYTGPVVAGSALTADALGNCYAMRQVPNGGSQDVIVERYDTDLSGVGWTKTYADELSRHSEYVAGTVYASSITTPGAQFKIRQLNASTGATNHTTLDAQGLAVAPGGGILARGKTVANAGTHLYDSVGVKQWTIENAINDRAVYVDALGLTYQWKAASVSNPKGDQLEVFDSSGTSIEIIEKADYVPAHPNGDDVDYDGHLAVNTCNPIGSVSRDIYCSGELTEGLGNPRRAWRTSGTDLVRGPVSGSAGTYLRIDGHWAIFT